LREQAAKCVLGEMPAAYAATASKPAWLLVWHHDDHHQVWGDRAYANYLLDLRAQAKANFKVVLSIQV